MPTLATLETICKGLGITLSQFFAEDEMIELTPEVRQVFDAWVTLSPTQREAVLKMLQAMHQE